METAETAQTYRVVPVQAPKGTGCFDRITFGYQRDEVLASVMGGTGVAGAGALVSCTALFPAAHLPSAASGASATEMGDS